jgi:hypothetical protein
MIAGYVCQPASVGSLDPLAGVACTSTQDPDGLVELVVFWGCRYDRNDELSVAAINGPCATATALAAAWDELEECNFPSHIGATCSAAGWQCTALGGIIGPAGELVSLCRRPDDPRAAVRMVLVYPP